VTAVSKRTRYEVLRRDGYRCRYCGATPDTGAQLTVDHVTPVSLGGTNDPSNLVAACLDCNLGKGASAPDAPLVQDVAGDHVAWTNAVQQAHAEDRAERDALAVVVDAFGAEWDTWQRGGARLPKPPNWRGSVASFLAAGLNEDDLTEFVRIAMESRADDVWRYFCGVAWNTVERRHRRAQQIVSDDRPAAGPLWMCSRHAGELEATCRRCEDEAVPPPADIAAMLRRFLPGV
jgi:hypothetical protein